MHPEFLALHIILFVKVFLSYVLLSHIILSPDQYLLPPFFLVPRVCLKIQYPASCQLTGGSLPPSPQPPLFFLVKSLLYHCFVPYQIPILYQFKHDFNHLKIPQNSCQILVLVQKRSNKSSEDHNVSDPLPGEFWCLKTRKKIRCFPTCQLPDRAKGSGPVGFWDGKMMGKCWKRCCFWGFDGQQICRNMPQNSGKVSPWRL